MLAANEHQECRLPCISRNNALPLHQITVGNHGKYLEEYLEEWFLLGELVCSNCHRSEGEMLPHEDQLQLPPPELIATP